MKVCVIGTGYVGLVVGTCLAEMGNNVICVDNDNTKLENLKNGIVPIFEPGLEELIKTNVSQNRLSFSDNIFSSVKKSQICFIAVGTPEKQDGNVDLGYVFEVAKEIAPAIDEYKVIVEKSTVPPGTSEKIREIILKETKANFDIVSNPEFLKQGAAVEDFLKPDRIILGSNTQKATELMKELYEPFLRTGNPIVLMDIKSAEMTKYASNTFLALKVSFANEIANICEKIGADVEMVRVGMCSDKRIGSQFLFAGLGWGGSCFPKDIKALLKTAQENNYDAKILKSVQEVNAKQRELFVDKILSHYKNDIKNKTFAVWGLSFKPKTDDLREAPSITIINKLLDLGAKIKAFDPKANKNAQKIFKDKIIFSKTSQEALENADALLLLTEWNEFRKPDFEKIKNTLKEPVIFDGRNQYDLKKLKDLGIICYQIGRKQ